MISFLMTNEKSYIFACTNPMDTKFDRFMTWGHRSKNYIILSKMFLLLTHFFPSDKAPLILHRTTIKFVALISLYFTPFSFLCKWNLKLIKVLQLILFKFVISVKKQRDNISEIFSLSVTCHPRKKYTLTTYYLWFISGYSSINHLIFEPNE